MFRSKGHVCGIGRLATPLAGLLTLGMMPTMAAGAVDTLVPVVFAGGRPFETGVTANAAVSVSPKTGLPGIVCNGVPGSILYVASTGQGWTLEKVAKGWVNEGSLAFDPDTGEPWIGFGTNGPGVHLAFNLDGRWTSETLDTSWQVFNKVQVLIPPTTTTLFLIYNAFPSEQFANEPVLRYAERVGRNDYRVGMVDEAQNYASGSDFSALLDPETLSPTVAYRGADEHAQTFIRYARWTGDAWTTQLITMGAYGKIGFTYAMHGGVLSPEVLEQYSLWTGIYYYLSDGIWKSDTFAPQGALVDFLSNPTNQRPVLFCTRNSTTWMQTLEPTTDTLEEIGPSRSQEFLAFGPTGTVFDAALDLPPVYAGHEGTLSLVDNNSGAFVSNLIVDWYRPGLSADAAFAPGSSTLWTAWKEGRSGALFLEQWDKGVSNIRKLADDADSPSLIFPSNAAKPWIVYTDTGIRLGVPDGDGYTSETVAASGSSPAAAIDRLTGNVCIVWYSYGTHFARRTAANTFQIENFDTFHTIYAPYSLVINSAGQPSIYGHVTYPFSAIARIYKPAASWVTEILARDSAGVSYSYPSAAAFPGGDNVAISYVKLDTTVTTNTQTAIMFQGWDGTTNRREETVFNAPGSKFARTMVVVDPSTGRPYVFFCIGNYAEVAGSVYLADRDATGWHVRLLSGNFMFSYYSDATWWTAFLSGAFSSTGDAAFLIYDAENQALTGWVTPSLAPMFAGRFFEAR